MHFFGKKSRRPFLVVALEIRSKISKSYPPSKKCPKNWLLLWLGVHFVSWVCIYTFSCKLRLKKNFHRHWGAGAGAPTPLHPLATPMVAYVECICVQVSHTFAAVPMDVHYVHVEHGGRDLQFWLGYFGPKFTATSVMVMCKWYPVVFHTAGNPGNVRELDTARAGNVGKFDQMSGQCPPGKVLSRGCLLLLNFTFVGNLIRFPSV